MQHTPTILRRALPFLLALCLCLPHPALATMGEAQRPLDTVTLLAAPALPFARAIIAGAALLADGSLLIAGNGASQDGSQTGWLLCLDAQTGAERWRHIPQPQDPAAPPYAAMAVTALADGYAACFSDGTQTVVLLGEGETIHATLPADGAARAVLAGPDGQLALAGQKDGAPWIAAVDATGTHLWSHVPTGHTTGATYHFVRETDIGLAAGGAEPGHVDLLDHFSWSGTWTASATPDNAGSMPDMRGLAIQNAYTAIVCGIAAGDGGETRATSAALDGVVFGILAGPQLGPAGSGWLDAVPFHSPSGTASETLLCGFAPGEAAGQTQCWVALAGNDGRPQTGWYFPFGTDSRAVRILQESSTSALVIGEGNGAQIGEKAGEEGHIQPFVVRIDMDAVPDAQPVG